MTRDVSNMTNDRVMNAIAYNPRVCISRRAISFVRPNYSLSRLECLAFSRRSDNRCISMTSNGQQNLVSHLSVLYESASQFASETAFLIPHESNGDQKQDFSWDTVTYEQFLNDVERYALLWRRVLLSREISAGSIVGLWNVYNFIHSDCE